MECTMLTLRQRKCRVHTDHTTRHLLQRKSQRRSSRNRCSHCLQKYQQCTDHTLGEMDWTLRLPRTGCKSPTLTQRNRPVAALLTRRLPSYVLIKSKVTRLTYRLACDIIDRSSYAVFASVLPDLPRQVIVLAHATDLALMLIVVDARQRQVPASRTLNILSGITRWLRGRLHTRLCAWLSRRKAGRL